MFKSFNTTNLAGRENTQASETATHEKAVAACYEACDLIALVKRFLDSDAKSVKVLPGKLEILHLASFHNISANMLSEILWEMEYTPTLGKAYSKIIPSIVKCRDILQNQDIARIWPKHTIFYAVNHDIPGSLLPSIGQDADAAEIAKEAYGLLESIYNLLSHNYKHGVLPDYLNKLFVRPTHALNADILSEIAIDILYSESKHGLYGTLMLPKLIQLAKILNNDEVSELLAHDSHWNKLINSMASVETIKANPEKALAALKEWENAAANRENINETPSLVNSENIDEADVVEETYKSLKFIHDFLRSYYKSEMLPDCLNKFYRTPFNALNTKILLDAAMGMIDPHHAEMYSEIVPAMINVIKTLQNPETFKIWETHHKFDEFLGSIASSEQLKADPLKTLEAMMRLEDPADRKGLIAEGEKRAGGLSHISTLFDNLQIDTEKTKRTIQDKEHACQKAHDLIIEVIGFLEHKVQSGHILPKWLDRLYKTNPYKISAHDFVHPIYLILDDEDLASTYAPIIPTMIRFQDILWDINVAAAWANHAPTEEESHQIKVDIPEAKAGLKRKQHGAPEDRCQEACDSILEVMRFLDHEVESGHTLPRGFDLLRKTNLHKMTAGIFAKILSNMVEHQSEFVDTYYKIIPAMVKCKKILQDPDVAEVWAKHAIPYEATHEIPASSLASMGQNPSAEAIAKVACELLKSIRDSLSHDYRYGILPDCLNKLFTPTPHEINTKILLEIATETLYFGSYGIYSKFIPTLIKLAKMLTNHEVLELLENDQQWNDLLDSMAYAETIKENPGKAFEALVEWENTNITNGFKFPVFPSISGGLNASAKEMVEEVYKSLRSISDYLEPYYRAGSLPNCLDKFCRTPTHAINIETLLAVGAEIIDLELDEAYGRFIPVIRKMVQILKNPEASQIWEDNHKFDKFQDAISNTFKADPLKAFEELVKWQDPHDSQRIIYMCKSYIDMAHNLIPKIAPLHERKVKICTSISKIIELLNQKEVMPEIRDKLSEHILFYNSNCDDTIGGALLTCFLYSELHAVLPNIENNFFRLLVQSTSTHPNLTQEEKNKHFNEIFYFGLRNGKVTVKQVINAYSRELRTSSEYLHLSPTTLCKLFFHKWAIDVITPDEQKNFVKYLLDSNYIKNNDIEAFKLLSLALTYVDGALDIVKDSFVEKHEAPGFIERGSTKPIILDLGRTPPAPKPPETPKTFMTQILLSYRDKWTFEQLTQALKNIYSYDMENKSQNADVILELWHEKFSAKHHTIEEIKKVLEVVIRLPFAGGYDVKQYSNWHVASLKHFLNRVKDDILKSKTNPMDAILEITKTVAKNLQHDQVKALFEIFVEQLDSPANREKFIKQVDASFEAGKSPIFANTHSIEVVEKTIAAIHAKGTTHIADDNAEASSSHNDSAAVDPHNVKSLDMTLHGLLLGNDDDTQDFG